MQSTSRAVEQLRFSGSDPRNGDEPMTWESEVSWPDRDIMVCRGALPFLRDMIAPAEAHGKWTPCTVTDGESEYVEPGQRSSDRLVVTGPNVEVSDELAAYGVMLHTVEANVLGHYRDQNRHANIKSGSGYEMLRYGPGQKFGEHVDVIQGSLLASRRLSVVAFCNDDFEGGDLVFPRQDLRIKPEPGMLVLFPSGISFPHEAEPIKSGVRYSIVTWYF